MFFAPEPKKNAKGRVWDIKQVKSDLGSFICKHILFAHAISGSDTTLRLFGLGKETILKLKENTQLQQAALVFDNPNSNHDQVREAGEKALVAIYGGKKTDSLNQLRYKKYTEKVAKSLTQVDPKNLPPTSAAAKYHSYRVFLQVTEWKDIGCDISPESWGWMITESGFKPIATDNGPAPEELLKMIYCSCTSDCSSAQCSCRKHGLPCTPACGQCRGSGCQNALPCVEDDEIEELDE